MKPVINTIKIALLAIFSSNALAQNNEFDYPLMPDTTSREPYPVGAIAGTFDVSATGAATYTIPISIPVGRNGLQPTVAITYNSQSGNGLVGWGCNIAGISTITRGAKTIYHDGAAKGITHDADDAYYLDGQRLILASCTATQEGAIYYPENDPFTKIIAHGVYNDNYANTSFEVQHSDGRRSLYGGKSESYNYNNKPRIHAWHLYKIYDTFGNRIEYSYQFENNFVYPATISYGYNENDANSEGYIEDLNILVDNTIWFEYETRPDSLSFFIEGNIKGVVNKRLKSITSNTADTVFRKYELEYENTDHFSRLAKVTEINNANERMAPTSLSWERLPGFNQSVKSPYVKPTDVPFGVKDNRVYQVDQHFLAADLNGDGLDDLVGIFPYDNYTYYGMYAVSSQTNVVVINWASLNNSGEVQFNENSFYDIGSSYSFLDWSKKHGRPSVLDFDGDGIKDLLIPSIIDNKKVRFKFAGGKLDTWGYEYPLQKSSEMPLYVTGDFNNDGKGEILLCEKGGTAYSSGKNYPCLITGFASDSELESVQFTLYLPSQPQKMFTADYNGDGMLDIMAFYDGGYSIFWNHGGELSSAFSSSTTGSNISNVWNIWDGDFNGDGLIDFLMSCSDWGSTWKFAINNGDGSFTVKTACTLNLHDQDFTDRDDDKFSCLIYDFNMDGKQDVIVQKTMYEKFWNLSGWHGRFDKTYTVWMYSEGNSLKQAVCASSDKEVDGYSHRYLLGDFNGDGVTELMNYGYNCYSAQDANVSPYWNLYQNPNLNVNCGKITSIDDGFTYYSNISYASLTGDIYTKGTDAAYPVADYTLPLHTVKTITCDQGNTTLNYRYNGLKIHLEGKGLMGFTSITAENKTLGSMVETGVLQWNANYYVPSKTYSKTTIGGSTAQSEVTYNFSDKGNKKYFAYPTTKRDVDLDSNTVISTYQYDTDLGYIKEEKAEFGNNMYKKVQYSSYVLAGRTYKPRLVNAIQKHSDDNQPFSNKTSMTYDAITGAILQVIENDSTQYPLTTDYTYNDYGNVITSATSGSGVPKITNHYEYDPTHRFVTKTYTSPASSINTYSYDVWGNVLTENDETNPNDILTTTYTYDNWGILTKTDLPDGRTTERSANRLHWVLDYDDEPVYDCHLIQTETSGQPWLKTYYDNQGREILNETVGRKGLEVSRKTYYNAKGQIYKKETVQGNLSTTERFYYDLLGRLDSTCSSAGQSVKYIYGNRSVTTKSAGKTVTKTFDAWGNVKTVTDPVSSINYTYKSVGKPATITTGGATFAMTYYDNGLQYTLTDPNAGKTTYTYDAAGRIIKQRDGRGKITTNDYDTLGRLKSSTIDGVVTDYTYGTTGNDKLHLTKIQTGNNQIEYLYDNLGRIETEIRQVDGTNHLFFEYMYDNNSRLYQIFYPSNLQVTRLYDDYGYLTKVVAGSSPIWELTDETGTVTTSDLAGHSGTHFITRDSRGFTTNLATNFGCNVVQNMNFVFDPATGNLTSRSGINGTTESFQYDAADRLKKVTSGSYTQMQINYASNGNILSKTGVGDYGYENMPHAVSYIDNPGPFLSQKTQIVQYNGFNKASSVSDSIGSDAYKLDIIYGPDRQRWKSSLKKNNILQKSIIFAGDYEQITENGVTRHFHYISGGDGLAAVYVKQTGQTDKAYYALTDHLGSICNLTDSWGESVFAASYDAWGKQTVSVNTIGFHRGYTGHEHLSEFNLINMNGRMYDPVLARFLSPDPFVQMPDFSQNFNRYSYCLNNPMKYTDPSGNVIGVDDIIVIAALAYFGGLQANFFFAAQNGKNPINPLNWNWKNPNTYISIASGALGASGIPALNLNGAIPNGLLYSGIGVLRNGFDNQFDGNSDTKFFDNWYYAAGLGFISGAYGGYNKAKANDKNVWWGNEVKYNRTQNSFWNVNKPDGSVRFNKIRNVGSRAANDCVPTSLAEIESSAGGKRPYSHFVKSSGYVTGDGVKIENKEEIEALIRNNFDDVTTLSQSEWNTSIYNPSYMQDAADHGAVISVHFKGHLDNVRQLDYYFEDPTLNTLHFRESKYNFNRWNIKNTIYNIFRIY